MVTVITESLSGWERQRILYKSENVKNVPHSPMAARLKIKIGSRLNLIFVSLLFQPNPRDHPPLLAVGCIELLG
jgi:hypothetical protein